MSVIYMIRHGQASFGQSNYDRLSNRGVRQSEILAEFLLGRRIFFDHIYTGTLQRQIDTAERYLEGRRQAGEPEPDIIRTERLNEYDSTRILKTYIPPLMAENPAFGQDVQAMFSDMRSFQRVFEAVMNRWIAADSIPAGLPRWDDFSDGVFQAIRDIMKNHGRGKTIAVFTSGGPIAAVVQRALGLSGETAMRINWQIVNASITRFKCTHEEFMLATFNEHGHLARADENLVTYR